MNDEAVLGELAKLAAELSPAGVANGEAELLAATARLARRMFAAAAASVALLEEGQSELVVRASSGKGEERIVGVRIPVGRGIAGWAAASGQPVSVDDVTRDPRFARDVAESSGYLPTSILAMPLETEREVLGVIEVLDRAPGHDDLELIRLLARQVALAVEIARAHGDLGRLLLDAVAGAEVDRDLPGALERIRASSEGPRAELADLAALLTELGRAGSEERAVATRLVREFTSYIRARAAAR